MKGFGLAAMLALAVIASGVLVGLVAVEQRHDPAPASSPSATQSSFGRRRRGCDVRLGSGRSRRFVFSPNTVTIAEHGVVTVKNVGTVPHTFTIQIKGINQAAEPGPRRRRSPINLAPGTTRSSARSTSRRG